MASSDLTAWEEPGSSGLADASRFACAFLPIGREVYNVRGRLLRISREFRRKGSGVPGA